MQCFALSKQTQKSLSLFQGLNPSYEIKKTLIGFLKLWQSQVGVSINFFFFSFIALRMKLLLIFFRQLLVLQLDKIPRNVKLANDFPWGQI